MLRPAQTNTIKQVVTAIIAATDTMYVEPDLKLGQMLSAIEEMWMCYSNNTAKDDGRGTKHPNADPAVVRTNAILECLASTLEDALSKR